MGGAPLRNRQNLECLGRLGPVSTFSIFKGNLPSHSEYTGFNQDLIRNWQHLDLNSCQRSIPEKLRRRCHWFRPYGHYYTDWIYTAQAAQHFKQYLKQVQPNLIVLAELWLHPYLSIARQYRQAFPHCRIILDSHNVEGNLAQERIPPVQHPREWLQPARWELALRPRRVRRMEQHALAQVDQMWVCSPEDAATMTQLYGSGHAAKLRVVPNGVNISAYGQPREQQNRLQAEEPPQPPSILFLGSFAYRPNEIAARILLEEIYPRLRDRLPNLQLQFVGSEPTPWMKQAAQTLDGVEVTGKVESVLPYLQNASAMVVPLRHGSGTRLKLLEAFAAHLPVVSTLKGAEGLAVRDGEHVLLRDEVPAMAAGVEELLHNPQLSQRLAQAAHQLVTEQYSWVKAGQHIQTAVATLFESV